MSAKSSKQWHEPPSGACPARCGSGPAGDVAGNAEREGEIDASNLHHLRTRSVSRQAWRDSLFLLRAC